jgi:poly-gamma-glutamate capsule biosynthesis protein CapA/YwtB (metallophosphatase superfamily)
LKSNKIIVTLVGDICLDSIDLENIVLEDKIKSILLSSSIAIGNLESPVTESEIKQKKLPVYLKTDVKSIKVLKYFSALSLANNHIFDYGVTGFNDTIDFLIKNNICFFGAGKNAEEAKIPLTIEKDIPQKIALITGTRWTNAKLNEHGTAKFRGHAKNIRDLKLKGYFIIYYPHWGYEYILTPPPDVRTHARKMIELGVDLVVGTHPHLLQGFEEFKGKYIFYSLGNFIFHHKHIERLTPKESQNRVKTSVILTLYLNNGSVDRVELHPIKYSNEKIQLILGMDKEDIITDMNENSKIFKKSKITYLKKYYSQVSDIVKQNQKIRSDFQNYEKLCFVRKLLFFKNITKQDILNRLAHFTLFRKAF